uniref:Uncharacterized protein n=1 Tax=Leersia perrieri TaxID=77586 RepID=A0A0D9WSN4_9ORYZ
MSLPYLLDIPACRGATTEEISQGIHDEEDGKIADEKKWNTYRIDYFEQMPLQKAPEDVYW